MRKISFIFVVLTLLIPLTASISYGTDDLLREDSPLRTTAASTTQGETMKDVNLDEDVPGCWDNYHRVMRKFWIAMDTPFDIVHTLAAKGSALTVLLKTYVSFSPEALSKLGLSSLILGQISSFMVAGKGGSKYLIRRHEDQLRQIIQEAHKKSASNPSVSALPSMTVTLNDDSAPQGCLPRYHSTMLKFWGAAETYFDVINFLAAQGSTICVGLQSYGGFSAEATISLGTAGTVLGYISTGMIAAKAVSQYLMRWHEKSLQPVAGNS